MLNFNDSKGKFFWIKTISVHLDIEIFCRSDLRHLSVRFLPIKKEESFILVSKKKSSIKILVDNIIQ
jgi:hypothetical protein